jgi:hypothetical protein
MCQLKIPGGYDGIILHYLNVQCTEYLKNVAKKYNEVCPICSIRPGGKKNIKSADFIGHMDLRHNSGVPGCGNYKTMKKQDAELVRYYCFDGNYYKDVKALYIAA